MTTINGKNYAKFDMHIHTAETSKCGTIPANKLVQLYREHGYDGFVITDHLHGNYIALQSCRDDWQECMTRYLFGYKEAKRAGDAIGFDVVLGAELRFPESDRDYLLYGIDEDFLRANPYLFRTDHASFFKRFGDKILIVQAHPYREFDVVYRDSIHGMEIVNTNPRHNSRNDLALRLAKENPELYRICGSDTHRPGDEAKAAVYFEDPAHDSCDVMRAIKSGRYRLWSAEFDSIIRESGASI